MFRSGNYFVKTLKIDAESIKIVKFLKTKEERQD